MTNNLYSACQYSNETAKEEFKKTVHNAVKYVKYHFSTEEQIMEKVSFPEFQDHKKQHTDFTQEVLNEVKAFEEGKKFVPNQFVRFLRDWVLSHIAITDSKLGEFLVKLQKEGKLGKITMKKKAAEVEKKIVLAVDDSKTQLMIFKVSLPRYDVYTCESPIHALEMAKNMDIDIVLLDLAMEEMSGFEFLRQFKEDARLSAVPVLIVSSNTTEQHITASMNLGASGFISKPIHPETLNKKIEAVIGIPAPLMKQE
jgi:hemerythrin